MAPPVTLRIKLRSKKRKTSPMPQTPLPSASDDNDTSNAETPAPTLNITLRSKAKVSTSSEGSNKPSEADLDQPSTSGTVSRGGESYRQRLKRTRPADYELLLIKDAKRKREKRKSMTKANKKKESEGSKFQMRKLRAQRKELQEKAAKANPVAPKERKTRAQKKAEEEELEKKRKKDRDYQRERRAKFSEAKRKEINALRREKKKKEKEELLEYRKMIRKAKEEEEERARRVREIQETEKDRLENLNQEEMSMDNDILMQTPRRRDEPRSASARRQSLSRARAAIPKNPRAYADTIEDLQKKASPRKAAILKDRGLSVDIIDQVIQAGLKERLQKLRRKRCKKYLAKNRELTSVLALAKKYKLQRKICKKMNITGRNITSDPQPFRYRSAQEVPQATNDRVWEFYEDNSVELPDQKGVSKKTLNKSRVLEMPVPSLHKKYLKEHPQYKVGLTSFFPTRTAAYSEDWGCQVSGMPVREYCENATLKLRVLNNACSAQKKTSANVDGISKAVALTMCPKEGKFHKRACIQRECERCGVGALSTHVKDLDLSVEVKWKYWTNQKREILTKDGGKKKIDRKE